MEVRVNKDEVVNILESKLIKFGFNKEEAAPMAKVFMTNSLEGVYSHGVNRFGRFLDYVEAGVVEINAKPIVKSKSKGLEQWDGRRAAGILNAISGVRRAMDLSDKYGIGCLAIGNTNHWMRGGTYGRIAAKKGYVLIAWTNTIANLPAWGAKDCRLGNNPLVMAVPGKEPVVIDMAMSQYSYGKLEDLALKEEVLDHPGGFNKDGEQSFKPKEILAAERPIPIGLWKGAGLSLVLDLLASILSDGLSTAELSKQKIESGVSQVFICINPKDLSKSRSIAETVKLIINDYKESIPQDEYQKIVYPGERTGVIVKQNSEEGIPINIKVWEDILSR